MPVRSPSDFTSFLDEVAREVAAHVDPWRLRVGEAAARWSAHGVSVQVLERALRLTAPPDVDALLTAFEAAARRCRALAAEATALDPALAGHEAFRDPARVGEAEALVRRLTRASPPAPSAPRPSIVDPEGWVIDWPYVADILVEEWR